MTPPRLGKVVFLGTPDAAVPILGALAAVATVEAVVTRPDRPRGRSKRLVAPPVKEAALGMGLKVVQPSSNETLLAELIDVAPEVAVVAAYGRLIRPELLDVPRHGFVNVHYSLLPRWRGASPVVRAILAGDAVTGVSLMKMDAGLDTGPVFAMAALDIRPFDDTGTLTDRLARLGGRLLVDELSGYLGGTTTARDQDADGVTAAAKVTTDEARIDPIRHTTVAIDRAIRAFNPKPGAWALLEGERFKIWRAQPAEAIDAEVGQVVFVEGEAVLTTRDGAIELVDVQPAGKPSMSARAWMNGRRGALAVLR